MGKKKELVGQKFNRLLVIQENGKSNTGQIKWDCICDCGEKVNLIGWSITSGKTKSCGCYRVENSRAKATKHDMCSHPLYDIWNSMKQRCENENNDKYINYGYRGIKICDEWRENISCFIDWAIENDWNTNLEVDRIDNNGNYCPENCQLITHTENMAIGKRRQQKNNTSGYNGITFSKQKNKWQAVLKLDRKTKSIGFFLKIEDAIEARINYEIELFGEQRTNLHYKKV